MFENIRIIKNKAETEPKHYWSFGWSFEYKGEEYGTFVDNVKRDNNIFGTSFLGIFSADPNKKLTCEIQILMLEEMLKSMKGLIKKIRNKKGGK